MQFRGGAALTGPPQTVELGPLPLISARQQHAVDHMDNAVRLKHVLDRDLGSIALGVPDLEHVAPALDRDRLAFIPHPLPLAGRRRVNVSHISGRPSSFDESRPGSVAAHPKFWNGDLSVIAKLIVGLETLKGG